MCLRSHRPFLHSSSTHSPSSVLAESRAPKRKKTQKYPVENKFPTLSPSHQNGSTGTHCPLVAGAHIRTPLDHSRTFLLLLLLLQGPVPQNRRLEWKQPAEQQRGGKAQKKVFEVETLAVALRMIRWEGESLFIIFRLQNNNTMYTHALVHKFCQGNGRDAIASRHSQINIRNHFKPPTKKSPATKK